MTVTVRRAISGDGAGISRAWLSAGTYYADLDPEHFQVPRVEGLAEDWDGLADKEKGPARKQLLRRAYHWYSEAANDTENLTGIHRV